MPVFAVLPEHARESLLRLTAELAADFVISPARRGEIHQRVIRILGEPPTEVGALQNRLQSTINNLGIYRENLAAANSRIRDTDIAEETSELMKNNFLTQSTVSVLGQANSNAQMALKLLG